MKESALIIVDAQRGFMPTEEGIRLGEDGFGELPVKGGELIVPNVNRMLAEYAIRGAATFTTQDWHPLDTAHFSDNPNYDTTWPIHCVGDTPGALLHPFILLPDSTEAYRKGMETLQRGEDDESYSGFGAINAGGKTLGERLKQLGVSRVALGGLALDYCVAATALDIRTKLGLEVVIAVDATKSIGDITDESYMEVVEKLEANNIELSTTYHVLHELELQDA